MNIKCHILNFDVLSEKLGLREEKIWAEFRGKTEHVISYMEFLEENIPITNCVEVWWTNGKSSILDIPFKDFDERMTRRVEFTRHTFPKAQ